MVTNLRLPDLTTLVRQQKSDIVWSLVTGIIHYSQVLFSMPYQRIVLSEIMLYVKNTAGQELCAVNTSPTHTVQLILII